MIAVFSNNDEVIFVHLDQEGNFIDLDEIVFGPESGRDIDNFERFDVDTDDKQEAIKIAIRVIGLL